MHPDFQTDLVQIVATLVFGMNFLITLIWWTIPWCINSYRYKYNLSLRKIPWPIASASKPEAIVDVWFYSAIGLLVVVPAIIGYVVYKVVMRKIVCRFIASIAFSKEEKTQIALGTIEKKKD